MAFIEIEHMGVPPWIDVSPYLPEVAEIDKIRTCVVLGSFGKFHDQINETIGTLEESGIRVLAPKRAPITDGQGFQLLATDTAMMEDLKRKYPEVTWTKDHFAAVIEKVFKRTIDQAGFIYVVNPSNIVAPDGSMLPNGYAGTMAASEIGHAMAMRKPIYSLEPLDPTLDEQEGIIWSPHWRAVAQAIKPYQPDDLVTMVNSGQLDVEDYRWCDGYKSRWFR